MKLFKFTIVFVIIGIIFFKIGVYYGVYQFHLYDSPYKAFMAATQLEKIQNKETAIVETIQQNRLTEEIINYGKFLDHGIPWLLWPENIMNNSDLFDKPPSRKEFMEKAIAYRRNNPIEFPYDLTKCEGNNRKEEPCKTFLKINFYYKKAMGMNN